MAKWQCCSECLDGLGVMVRGRRDQWRRKIVKWDALLRNEQQWHERGVWHLDIKTSGGDIGGDEDSQLAAAVSLHGPVTHLL